MNKKSQACGSDFEEDLKRRVMEDKRKELIVALFRTDLSRGVLRLHFAEAFGGVTHSRILGRNFKTKLLIC